MQHFSEMRHQLLIDNTHMKGLAKSGKMDNKSLNNRIFESFFIATKKQKTKIEKQILALGLVFFSTHQSADSMMDHW